MKYYLTTLLVLVSLGLFSMQSALGGEPVVVIVNKSNQQSLTQQDIKNIYNDIVFHWNNGERIAVYNLPVDAEEREAFSKKMFGETAQRMAAEESNRKITNTIKNPSKTKRARLVAQLVAKNPHAIGYIPLSMLDKSDEVRVVLQID
ncbi:substrate-binding domain-containing protein [Kaarinaea lacus]